MRVPYRIVRPLARIALKIYFKKIFLTGLDNLPKGKPTIIAANHPTAFLEPCLLACLLPMPLHFMVRGDFFQHPIAKKILESLQMIPMYRKKDIGMKGVKQNFSSLDAVYDLLNENKAILILAEGTTVHEKRLRPIKKGAARMAIGALEKYPNLDVQIVTIGVNYTDVLQFRSSVMLDIGPAISVASYLQTPDWHRAKVINQLTKSLKQQLHTQVIHIAQQEDEALTEGVLDIIRNEKQYPTFPVQVANRQPLIIEIEAANFINNLEEELKIPLAQATKNYTSALQITQLSDVTVKNNSDYSLKDRILYLLGYPFYIIGRGLNFLPLFFGKWWSENKVREIEFIAPIKASFSLGAYLFYFLILLTIGLLINQQWYWLLLLLIPCLGAYSLLFYDFKVLATGRWQWSKLPKSKQESFLSLRNNILSLAKRSQE